MIWEFNGEAWDTEERLLGKLQSYTCALTLDTGEQIDIEFVKVGNDYATGDPYLAYRDWSENELGGGGYGPVKQIPYEQVTKLFVY